MKVEEILASLKTKASLSESEVQELEKSFSEIIDLKLTKQLGEELTEDQQNKFVAGLKDIETNKNPEKITQVLQQTGFNPDKAKSYLNEAVKQALIEIINILGDKISEKDRQDLLATVAF